MKVGRMCRVALMTALLCVVGPMTIPVGPVPISLATLVVYLSGALLGAKQGTLAVAMYILIGSAGVPVFSGFSAGIQKIAGVTGGYMLGYLLCAATVGLAAERGKMRWTLPAAMVFGTVLCYAVGTAWFMAQTGVNIAGALVSCVIPFLPGDVLKIIAAIAVVKTMKKDWSSR